MVKARVSGVPYPVDLPEESINDILFEFNRKILEKVEEMSRQHLDDIATLEQEIRLVRARNERLEGEVNALIKRL